MGFKKTTSYTHFRVYFYINLYGLREKGYLEFLKIWLGEIKPMLLLCKVKEFTFLQTHF